MDGAAEKLLKALRDLEQEQWRIANKIAVVKAALSLAGVEVPATATTSENEDRYVRHHLFAQGRLIDCCERIVNDHQGEWLNKGRVAYLLERGGYTSGARELANSVDCTLRRLASLGRIAAQKCRGPHGNQYRCLTAAPANPELKPA